ncbi:MAG: hypothetical protein V4604_16290 [Bacteroidota bacterium]
MNQRTVLGIILVFVLTIFTQCTVQKRLYRKGYYISFHKTPKRITETQEEKQLAAFQLMDSTNSDSSLEPEESQLAAVESPELKELSSDPAIDETTTSFSLKSVVNRAKATTNVLKQVISIGKKASEPTTKAKPRHARTAIVVTMILLIAAGIGLIFLGLNTLSPYPVLLGILVAIGAVIGLFVGLVVEDTITNKEREEEERKVRKEKEQKLSEEEWMELKQKQYQKAVRTTILLIVLFFGISLFAIAVGEPMPLIAITGAMFLIFLAFVWGTYKTKRKDDPVISTES